MFLSLFKVSPTALTVLVICITWSSSCCCLRIQASRYLGTLFLLTSVPDSSSTRPWRPPAPRRPIYIPIAIESILRYAGATHWQRYFRSEDLGLRGGSWANSTRLHWLTRTASASSWGAAGHQEDWQSSKYTLLVLIWVEDLCMDLVSCCWKSLLIEIQKSVGPRDKAFHCRSLSSSKFHCQVGRDPAVWLKAPKRHIYCGTPPLRFPLKQFTVYLLFWLHISPSCPTQCLLTKLRRITL